MTIQPITIENGRVTIRPTTNGVWLAQSQIADLFGVFTAAVNANIRAIFKSGVLHEEHVCRRIRCRDGNIVEPIQPRNGCGIGIPAQIGKRRGIQTMDRRTSDDTRNRLEDADVKYKDQLMNEGGLNSRLVHYICFYSHLHRRLIFPVLQNL